MEKEEVVLASMVAPWHVSCCSINSKRALSCSYPLISAAFPCPALSVLVALCFFLNC